MNGGQKEHFNRSEDRTYCDGNFRACNCDCGLHPDLVKLQDGAAPGADTVHRDELIAALAVCVGLERRIQKLEEIAAISTRFR